MRRYGVDAAVLYSDIVVPAHAVGFGIDVAPGTGPVADRAVRATPPTSIGCGRSTPRPTSPTCVETVRLLVRTSCRPTSPLLAFAGAPFTVASYLIEGGPVRTYEHTKALMHTDDGVVARR